MLVRLNAQLFSTVRRSRIYRRHRRSLRLRWTRRERAVHVQHELTCCDVFQPVLDRWFMLYVMGLVQIPRTRVDRRTIGCGGCGDQERCESHASIDPVVVRILSCSRLVHLVRRNL